MEKKLTKSQIIMKIKFMSKEEYEEFSELVDDWFDIRRYLKQFTKFWDNHKESNNLNDLENAILNLLNSKKCKIREIRKLDDNSLWVSYTTYPPRSKSVSYSIRNVEDFIAKYPH